KRGTLTSASSSSQLAKFAALQGLVVPPALSTARSMGSRDVLGGAGSSNSQLLLSQHSGLKYPALAPKAN
ncbi:hypothetical protein Tco_0562973, partial [Tanacetum coccineum]